MATSPVSPIESERGSIPRRPTATALTFEGRYVGVPRRRPRNSGASSKYYPPQRSVANSRRLRTGCPRRRQLDRGVRAPTDADPSNWGHGVSSPGGATLPPSRRTPRGAARTAVGGCRRRALNQIDGGHSGKRIPPRRRYCRVSPNLAVSAPRDPTRSERRTSTTASNPGQGPTRANPRRVHLERWSLPSTHCATRPAVVGA